MADYTSIHSGATIDAAVTNSPTAGEKAALAGTSGAPGAGNRYVTDADTRDHGALGGLADDDHSQYLLLAGRVGGQSVFGGTVATNDLNLAANTVGTGAGVINANSPIVFAAYGATSSVYGFTYTATESFTSAFIGGGLNFSGAITFSNSTFIYESYRGSPTINTAVAPGFSAYTVLQALPVLNAGAGASHRPVSPLIINAGPTVQNTFSGTRTTPIMTGFSWVGRLQTTVSGAVMNVTDYIGINCQPAYSNVAGATINFGTIKGLVAKTPAVALFGSDFGTRSMTAYYAVDVENLGTFGGTAEVAALRSAITAGTNQYFLLNTGGGQSDFGTGVRYGTGSIDIRANNVGVRLGSAQNVDINWNGTALEIDPVTGDDLRTTFAAGVHTIQSSAFATAAELRMGFTRFAFGQTSAVGNQVGVFVAPTRSTTVAGGWSDFLLTQAGNITVGHAMSQLSGWTINAPSITLGAGTVTDAMALLIGGNVNQGTNRYGLQVLSSPTGGTLNYCARFSGAAGVRIDGILEHAGSSLGVFGTAPTTQPTVTGSRGGNAALASLLTGLASLGIVVDSTSA